MFEKVVVVDARAHLLGRLASIVAKELLSGYVYTLFSGLAVTRFDNTSGSLWATVI
jgi:ribosomal protein L13